MCFENKIGEDNKIESEVIKMANVGCCFILLKILWLSES